MKLVDSGYHNINRGYAFDGKNKVLFIDNALNLCSFDISQLLIDKNLRPANELRFTEQIVTTEVEDFYLDRKEQSIYILKSKGEVTELNSGRSSHKS